jgi:hypothetical protein
MLAGQAQVVTICERNSPLANQILYEIDGAIGGEATVNHPTNEFDQTHFSHFIARLTAGQLSYDIEGDVHVTSSQLGFH